MADPEVRHVAQPDTRRHSRSASESAPNSAGRCLRRQGRRRPRRTRRDTTHPRTALARARPGENANEDLAEVYKEVGRALGQSAGYRRPDRPHPRPRATCAADGAFPCARPPGPREGSSCRHAAAHQDARAARRRRHARPYWHPPSLRATQPARRTGLARSPAPAAARTRQHRRGENRARHGCLFSESRAQRPHCRQEAPICGRDQPGDRRLQSERRNQEPAQGAGGARRDSRSCVAVRHPYSLSRSRPRQHRSHRADVPGARRRDPRPARALPGASERHSRRLRRDRAPVRARVESGAGSRRRRRDSRRRARPI